MQLKMPNWARSRNKPNDSFPQNDASNTECYGRQRQNRKIKPEPGDYPDFKILEIRPKRFLRVKHINPRPRDAEFEKEMQTFIENQKNGKQRAASAKKRAQILEQIQRRQSANQVHVAQHPNAPMENTAPQKQMPFVIKTENGGEPTFSKSKPHVEKGSPRKSELGSPRKGELGSPRKSTKSHNVRVSTASSVRLDIHQRSVQEPIVSQDYDLQKSSADGPNSGQCIQMSLQNKPPSGSSGKSQNLMRDTNAVIFFIHGVGGSVDVWQAQLDYFAEEGYEIVAMDLIGHGFSCTPSDSSAYDFSEITKDLMVIFDMFCKRRNVVIGHSYG